jgi:molybdopterin synthase catalytic subunit
MVKVTEEPINPAAAYELVNTKNAGSAVFHYAVVKGNTGREKATTCIDYRQNGDMVAELEEIAADLRDKWFLDDVLLVRRTGCLAVGEIISLVAASSPNSADAFEACRHGISRLKSMTTVRKEEVFR